MNGLNITEYKKIPGQDVVYYGSAKVKKGFYFVDADEAFYHFIGKNSVYSMLELIHPEDRACFLEAAACLTEGEQCIIVRMKCYNDTYRCLYMTLRLNGRMYGGFESFTFDFCDVMEIKNRYEKYLYLVKKYRGFMALSSLLYWEYRFEDDEFTIYHYVNVKSQTLLVEKLETIRRKVEKAKELDAKSKAEFDTFYQFLQKGTDQFSTQVDGKVFLPEEEGVSYLVKGNTMYRKDEKYIVAGIFNVQGKKEKSTSYYLTDSAIDPGTGLFNKRAINEYAMEKIEAYQAGQRGIYLAVIDVDDFKKINDTYGHMFGDEVLSKVSEIMRTVLASRGIVGRFGGDEFMIVIDGAEDEENLRRIIKTICKHILWEYEEKQNQLKITTSWGIAKYPDDAENFEELFQKADKALYIAKAKGKNRLIIYDEAKHGSLEAKEGDSRDSGIRTIASDEKKAAVVTELVMDLYQNGRFAFEHVMETMCAYFDVDGMAIYKGEELKRSCSYGKYVNPIRSLELIKDKQYLEFFDEQGVYEESNVKRLNTSFVDIYELYAKQENGKFIQCITMEDGALKALVAFDFFNRYPKVGVTDMGLIKIVGRLMAEIAAKDE